MTRLALMSLLATLAICAHAPAEDWPRFRGSNGSGVADSTSALIPAKWDERDVTWKVELPGEGHSSPVIFGNKLFLTSADRAVGKRYLLCIDARTGDTLWKREFEFSPYAQHRDNAYAAATPALDDKYVYVPWINPQRYELFAFDHDGNEVWKADLGPFRW